jgi:hypothetical protein
MHYLAEFYAPQRNGDATALAARARAAAGLGGLGARLICAIFVPEDELCFALFEAGSLEAVTEAGSRAELVFDRVLEVMAA